MVSTRGRVTIPKLLREQADIRAGDELEVIADGDRLVICKAVPHDPAIAPGKRSRESMLRGSDHPSP
jgi:AbrB family looped-hinge helix DNA binding protein